MTTFQVTLWLVNTANRRIGRIEAEVVVKDKLPPEAIIYGDDVFVWKTGLEYDQVRAGVVHQDRKW